MNNPSWIFAKPEPSPWKSEWRLEFERRSAEEKLNPQVYVKKEVKA
jgi:hypothetical protein